MNRYLDFEIDIEKIEIQINALETNDTNFSLEKNRLEKKKENKLKEIYLKLSAWDKVQFQFHLQL